MTYVTKTDISEQHKWAAQLLVIIHKRARQPTRRKLPFCDPRILLMLLLTPREQEHWRSIAVGSKSPTVPIGEIERLGLPDRILSKVKKVRHRVKPQKKHIIALNISYWTSFDECQHRLSKMRKLQSEMDKSQS